MKALVLATQIHAYVEFRILWHLLSQCSPNQGVSYIYRL